MVRLSNELFIFPTKFFSPVISDYRFLISDLNFSSVLLAVCSIISLSLLNTLSISSSKVFFRETI